MMIEILSLIEFTKSFLVKACRIAKMPFPSLLLLKEICWICKLLTLWICLEKLDIQILSAFPHAFLSCCPLCDGIKLNQALYYTVKYF